MNGSRTAQNRFRTVTVPTLYRWNRNQNRRIPFSGSGPLNPVPAIAASIARHTEHRCSDARTSARAGVAARTHGIEGTWGTPAV